MTITSNENLDIRTMIHDARGPLNRISMNAELVKLVLENDLPRDKALDALNKIITACQDCSDKLQAISNSHKNIGE
ncbi:MULTISPECIES: histidine kinase [Alteromonadaceae]|uniref:histidine kinase n=1 Tax=Alteromonadaceae TaxID=72275 RepID=UPI001C090C58|nr:MULTISPECIES: histidine kinase [Aliiglaciecola]MBU2877097.1 histidine kinase [Aliiglaciecola lipolytica]MDO6710184.1 histidine kinase [Aliiglaciecola sp. 2_MG-2023]MDO6751332.1 histidine kinase [Aliiglaciecola sp. 1_MG-2023]